MRKLITITPAPGYSVRDPATGAVLPAGETALQATTYWRRRIAEGSVQEITRTPGRARRKIKHDKEQ